MKKVVILLAFCFFIQFIYAQRIFVHSFRLDDKDLTANTSGTIVFDHNSQKCALIKIETTQKGFSFEAGSYYIAKTIQKTGEIWVYVSEGAKKLSIYHPEFGKLINYDIGQTLHKAKTYVMQLGIRSATESEYTIFYGAVAINSNPSLADIYIDNKLVGNTPQFISQLAEGVHTLKISRQGFIDYVGVFNVRASETTNVLASLEPLSDMNKSDSIRFDINIKGVHFAMIKVEGGVFDMGKPSKDDDSEQKDSDFQRVTLSDYYIGETEVTQDLWKAVMRNNPSKNKGSRFPVESVSWKDCQSFITKLNKITGEEFRMLSEAEWEYAARGGKLSYDYIYSGSNILSDVAWCDVVNLHDVKTKKPNELGIFDMSGNVSEWCQDKKNGKEQILRGSSFRSPKEYAKLIHKGRVSSDLYRDFIGLRLAASQLKSSITISDEKEGKSISSEFDMSPLDTNQSKSNKSISSSERVLQVSVDGVSFNMIRVDGGKFLMGATEEQLNDSDSDEMPAHQVVLSPYYIGETEVTQTLWKAIMHQNPSEFKGGKRPVENVSWEDCQDFIKKLNQMTGYNFCLPTEAEWEFAARGGNMSRRCKYSGSNNIDEIARYDKNIDGSTINVGKKTANELGIFDMSGNVWEWCQDWYGDYDSEDQLDPIGPVQSKKRVRRGGSWPDRSILCRVSSRGCSEPQDRGSNIGFRLALH